MPKFRKVLFLLILNKEKVDVFVYIICLSLNSKTNYVLEFQRVSI